MESYINKTSIIDKIISTQTVYNPTTTSVLGEQFVHRPMMISVHYKVR